MSDHKAYISKAVAYTLLLPSAKANISKSNLYGILTVPGKANITKANLYSILTVAGKVTVTKANLYGILTVPGQATITKANLYGILTVPGRATITKANLYVIMEFERGAYPPITFNPEGDFPFPACYSTTIDVKLIENIKEFKASRYSIRRPSFLTQIYHIDCTTNEVKKSDYDIIMSFYELKGTSKFFYIDTDSSRYIVRFIQLSSQASDLRSRYNVSFSVVGIRVPEEIEPTYLSVHQPTGMRASWLPTQSPYSASNTDGTVRLFKFYIPIGINSVSVKITCSDTPTGSYSARLGQAPISPPEPDVERLYGHSMVELLDHDCFGDPLGSEFIITEHILAMPAQNQTNLLLTESGDTIISEGNDALETEQENIETIDTYTSTGEWLFVRLDLITGTISNFSINITTESDPPAYDVWYNNFHMWTPAGDPGI